VVGGVVDGLGMVCVEHAEGVAARELVARTCREQGVPEKVMDPETLRRVAALLAPAEVEEPRGGVSGARSV
jgi:hypothetical protein